MHCYRVTGKASHPPIQQGGREDFSTTGDVSRAVDRKVQEEPEYLSIVQSLECMLIFQRLRLWGDTYLRDYLEE